MLNPLDQPVESSQLLGLINISRIFNKLAFFPKTTSIHEIHQINHCIQICQKINMISRSLQCRLSRLGNVDPFTPLNWTMPTCEPSPGLGVVEMWTVEQMVNKWWYLSNFNLRKNRDLRWVEVVFTKKQMVFGKPLTLRMPSGNTYTGRLRPGKRPMAAGIARVSPCTAISREKLVKWPGGTYIFNNLIFRFQYTRSLRFLKHISDIDITRFKEVSNRFYHVFTMFLPCFYHLSTCSHPAFEALCRHALRHSPAQLCRERPVCGRVAAHGLRSDASLCPLGEKKWWLDGVDGWVGWHDFPWDGWFFFEKWMILDGWMDDGWWI